MNDSDSLDRFLIAQQNYYRTALQEIKSGRKQSHWIWYIFPQIAGLGYSETARYYAIKDMNEAKAFLENSTLKKKQGSLESSRSSQELALCHHCLTTMLTT